MTAEKTKYYYKFIIKPNGIGITEDIFDWEGEIGLTRITYAQKHNNDYNFNYIKIGDSVLNYYPIISAYGLPTKISDYPVAFKFKKGDKFELSTDCEIEKVELFIANKINFSQTLKTSTDIKNK